MTTGRALHLRCFMEGVEVPIVSCSVSAALGGPASAHIEMLDSEKGFELLPRTLIHVFFFDDGDGSVYGSSDLFPLDDKPTGKSSTKYKLLFCGELFSIFHNKSAHGNRSLTIMALDLSNILDTNYIFQVSYNSVDGVLGTNAAAEAAFVSASSITNNPFDNIINSPQEVIKHIARRKASSAVHAARVSRLGGLFSIFELLLGVEGYSLGMNLWTSIHERMVRLLDMMAADSGKTAQKLFDDTIFNEWLTNSVSNQAPSMSYRDLAAMIMRYIYYDMVSIPTASYYKPTGSSGREAYTPINTGSGVTVPSEFRDYFSSSTEFDQAGQMDPEFLANVIKVIDVLRDSGYKSTYISSGFRTAAEADALYGSNDFKSPHSKGIAADIDWNNIKVNGIFVGSMFNLGNVALSKGRSLSGKDATIDFLRAEKYIKKGATSITDARIIRFLLDNNTKVEQWVAAEKVIAPLLFGGAIENAYQFLHYCLVYPLMSSCTMDAVGKAWWQIRRAESLDRYLKVWRLGFSKKSFVGRVILSNGKNSIVRGMLPTNPAGKWLSSWLSQHSATIEAVSISMGVDPVSAEYSENFSNTSEADGSSSLEKRTVTFTNFAGLADPAPFYVNGVQNTFMGIQQKEDYAVMDFIWHSYYEQKVTFWNEKGKAVDTVSASNEPKMYSGANRMILSGKPRFTPPMFYVFFNKQVAGVKTIGGGIGDDPVHIQSKKSFDVLSVEDYVSEERAIALYATRERVTGFLLRPDIWMCAPPKCNVIFPDDIVSLNISRELMRQTSRTFLMTYDELYADNVVFNGHYFAPQFDNDLPSIQKKAFGLSTSNEVIYPHEVYTGIIPKVNRISEVAFYSKATTVKKSDQQILDEKDIEATSEFSDNESKLSSISEKASPSTYDFVRKYASDVAHFNLMKQRYTANRVAVNAKFLPMLVPGLPAVVIGQSRLPRGTGFSSTHTWLGMIESVQHSYNQGGATTAVSLGTCRPYKTGDKSVDELLKLKKSGSTLFKTQDSSFAKSAGITVDAPAYLSFTSSPKLESQGTTFEEIIDKLPNRLFAFAGPEWFLEPDTVIQYVEDLCASSTTYLTKIQQEIGGQLSKVLYIEQTSTKKRAGLPIQVQIGYNNSKSTDEGFIDTPSPYDLLPIVGKTQYIFHHTFQTSRYYTGAYTDYYSTYTNFSGLNIGSGKPADKKALASAVLASTELQTLMLTDLLTEEVITVPVGEESQQLIELLPKAQPSPTVGHLVYEFQLGSPGVVDVRIESTSGIRVTPGMDATLLDVEIAVAVGGTGFVKIPILLPAEAYLTKVGVLSDDARAASSNRTSDKFRPLEEAIMPAWMDSAFKNGTITAPASVIDKGAATIDQSTGIGALYREWFSCDSIVDKLPYGGESLYSTVTIEEAVDNIISKYSTGSLGSNYKYTKRNIATLKDMLSPVTDPITDSIPKTGGFHARSVGNFDNLEGLGLTGSPIKGSLTTDKSVTISKLAQSDLNAGLSLDPRKERLARVKTYKHDVTKQRGKQG